MTAIQRLNNFLGPWQFSFLLHAVFSLFIAAVLIQRSTTTENVDIEVIENPVQATTSSPPKEIAQPVKKEQVVPAKAVFGVSRKAMLDESGAGESVKLGNTVTTAPDTKKLSDDDPDSLPIPAEEFLVSQMPTLVSEVRVPYPAEAKKRGIQGAVVMDILVDSAGKVRQATLVEGPGFGLNEAALEAVKGFQFKPALIENRAVAVKVRYAYRFVLER